MNALGLIETVGLAAAIAAADAAVKSANVQLHGYELTKGKGLVTVTFEGDVGAVTAGLDAAEMAAEPIAEVYSRLVIARPDDQLEKIIKKDEPVEMAEEPEPEPEEEPEETFLEEPADQLEDTEEVTSSGTHLENDVCNLCHDPACPRKKGDLKALCMHYGN